MALFIATIAALCLACSAAIVNLDVKRVVDVSSTVAISRTTIRMKNTGPASETFFHLAVAMMDARGLGDIWAVDGAASGRDLVALAMEPASDVPGLKPCCSGYKVTFAKPLEANAEVVIDVRMDVAGVIKPVPEVIVGHAVQYMRFTGNSHFYSPYKTEKMSTSMTLGSASITSKNGFKKPFGISGKKVSFGPYEDVEPLMYNEVSVRFKNDRGFLVATHAQKEFYVNHLANIAVKEEFKVVNDGARHMGEWSRVDHSSDYKSKYGSAMEDVWANLPEDATAVEYKDLVGNVTSSRLRKAAAGKRPVQLTYRYPLMGGWQNHFWLTYELVLKKYIKSEGNSHVAELPLFPSLNTDLLSKEVVVKVFLPEWSHGIEIVPHESLKVATETSSERTTLTMFGRPVFTLRMKMLRSQSKHRKTLTLKYKYSTGLTYVTPGLIGVEVLVVFLGCILAVRRWLGSEDEVVGVGSEKIKEM